LPLLFQLLIEQFDYYTVSLKSQEVLGFEQAALLQAEQQHLWPYCFLLDLQFLIAQLFQQQLQHQLQQYHQELH
jgi:hypothetical protein